MFLRRLKTDVNLDNHLPPKKTQVIDCPMVPEQEEMYKKFLNLSLGNKKDTAQVSSSNIIVPTLSGGRRRSCCKCDLSHLTVNGHWTYISVSLLMRNLHFLSENTVLFKEIGSIKEKDGETKNHIFSES